MAKYAYKDYEMHFIVEISRGKEKIAVITRFNGKKKKKKKERKKKKRKKRPTI